MSSKIKTVYLSLGSNMGDRANHLMRAKLKLKKLGVLSASSSIVESPAWGYKDPNAYLNMVLKLETSVDPKELMNELLDIEREEGRERMESSEKVYAARKIDIDILFYGNDIINEPDLEIPHPRLEQRNFILVPLAEISPNLEHPVLRKTIGQLVAESTDNARIVKYHGIH